MQPTLMNPYRIAWPSPQTACFESYELQSTCPPGQVLLKTEYSLISPGTEKAGFLNLPNTWGGSPFPRYPGYSSAGQILTVGDGVTDLKPGDRVVAYHSPHASHTYKHQRDIVRIEHETLDLKIAVFSIIAAMALQGVRKLKIELGESVLVMGLGLLGLFAVQFARLSGALPVLAMDLVSARRDLALKLGADHAFAPKDDGVVDAINALTRGGVNAVVEVSGAPTAVNEAFALMAPLARIALVGCSRTPTTEVDFYSHVHKPGITIIGAHNFVRPSEDSYPGYWTLREDLKTILRLLALGRLQAAPMIAEILSPKQAPKAYQSLAEGGANPPGVLFDWSRLNA